ncbi:Glycine/D-amino acid oxidase [Poseidonocella pacifica]|uniref:Glycine/D-amino acid oxidase n=1 Tax=Poseidonocella pacifica TaxID=871651 RepID=A0A1I0Y1G4_9RHOB|nr:FAD-binding oxidoreductase [Poseidonocella pacifica]SFB06486.1 Glycine/D-amino acid oxidase [Poseidonocella pacifica]
MRRLYEPRAYAAESLQGCYWPTTVELPRFPPPAGDTASQVAVVGAGFTGLSAALHLAEQGYDVAVFDEHQPGWGASGRNGGFCCIGGAMLRHESIVKRHGTHAAAEWAEVQQSAVELVDDLVTRHAMEVDRHSQGETVLAHSARAMRQLREDGGEVIERADLGARGISGPFHGGLRHPHGFALNPRKYLAGLIAACVAAGVRIHGGTTIEDVASGGLRSSHGLHRAEHTLLATNGYGAEDVPRWSGRRILPVFSNIMVTRPLTDAEREAQGWHSRQMCYDTRNLLHYFRLLPENRMLFGMRGGLRATESSDRRMARAIRAHFDEMFPAWRAVETTHFWSGLVCLTGARRPYIGPVPDMKGVWTGFGWHGNGVAMGTYAGRVLAGCVTGAGDIPELLRAPPPALPFGRFRRALLRPVFAGLALADRL